MESPYEEGRLLKHPDILLKKLLTEQGGRSLVFEGASARTGSKLAVKISKKDRSRMEVGETAGWINEATMLETLASTGAVVPFYAGGVSRFESADGFSQEVRYIVTALHEKSLAAFMDSGIPESQRFDLFNILLEQVIKLHDRGYAHRDLKPKNILVNDDGKTVVLADLYGAGIIGMPQDLTLEGGLWTINYMAPEQLDAPLQQLGPRVDVYALGVILHELYTKKLPFDRSHKHQREALRSPLVIDGALPEKVRAVVEKACSKNPERRYGTARELGGELRGK